MADNVLISPGSGATVLADEVTDGTLGTGVAQYVKLMDATLNSTNKAIVNAAGEQAFYGPDSTASGTITTTDIVGGAPAGAGALINAASTAGSLVSLVTVGGEASWTVQVTALTTGTLYFEGSLDSTTGTDGNWISLNSRRSGIVETTLANNASANGIYRGTIAGLKYFRVRSVGSLTGTPAILIRIGDGLASVFQESSMPAGTNALGAVQLGSSIGKANVGQTGTLASSATTADQVIKSYTVTAGKTLYIVQFDVQATLTTPAATFTNFGPVSLETPSGTKIWTGLLQGAGVASYISALCEPIPVAAGVVARLVTTPGAATAMTWRGNILGYEK